MKVLSERHHPRSWQHCPLIFSCWRSWGLASGLKHPRSQPHCHWGRLCLTFRHYCWCCHHLMWCSCRSCRQRRWSSWSDLTSGLCSCKRRWPPRSQEYFRPGWRPQNPHRSSVRPQILPILQLSRKKAGVFWSRAHKHPQTRPCFWWSCGATRRCRAVMCSSACAIVRSCGARAWTGIGGHTYKPVGSCRKRSDSFYYSACCGTAWRMLKWAHLIHEHSDSCLPSGTWPSRANSYRTRPCSCPRCQRAFCMVALGRVRELVRASRLPLQAGHCSYWHNWYNLACEWACLARLALGSAQIGIRDFRRSPQSQYSKRAGPAKRSCHSVWRGYLSWSVGWLPHRSLEAFAWHDREIAGVSACQPVSDAGQKALGNFEPNSCPYSGHYRVFHLP